MITTDLLFTCYPDKRIPESDEGQNLQLLHFSECDTEKYTEAIMKIEVSSMKYLLRTAAKKREKAGPISHMRDTGGRESEDFFKTEEEWDRKRRS